MEKKHERFPRYPAPVFFAALAGIILVIGACTLDPPPEIIDGNVKNTTAQNEEKDVADIEIVTGPGKTSYLMGEEFDTRGLTVKHIYTDGSEGLTKKYTISGDTFTAGTVSLAVVSEKDTSKKVSFTVDVSNQLVDTGLPVVYIETEDSAPIISKEDYVKTKIKIISDNPLFFLETASFDDAEIRGRGNSTWGYPKKPYRIKFDQKQSLFGLTAAKSWVLLANYKDSTLLANAITFELGKRFGMEYAHNYVLVDVVLNGNYQGNYLLTEHTQVGAGRVNIDENAGYLVELDVYWDEEPKFKTSNLQLPVMIKSPEDLIDPAGYDFVETSLNELDAALFDPGFPNNNYKDLLDINSFVDFILINEIVLNGELGWPKSTYLYKDVGGKIKMGPLWDFDWAFGLGGNTTIDISTAEGRFQGGWFFERFFTDPEFVSKYKIRWNEKYTDISGITTFIDEMSAKLKKPQSLNSKRWYAAGYEEEIAKLKTWWNRRITYLGGEINAK